MYKIKNSLKEYQNIDDLLMNNITDLACSNGQILNIECDGKILSIAEIIDETIKAKSTEDIVQAYSANIFHPTASSNSDTLNNRNCFGGQNASSGNNTLNICNMWSSPNASSGNRTLNISKQHSFQNASSGYHTLNATTGNNVDSASSGFGSQNISYGSKCKSASCGLNAINIIKGKNSIDCSCGYRTITQGINGTWFCLASYHIKFLNNTPAFMKCGCIGVDKDFRGEILQENQFYELIDKDFVPINIVDGNYMIIMSKKRQVGEYLVYSAYYDRDFAELEKNATLYFIAEKDGITAHGYNVKNAIASLCSKLLRGQDMLERITEVKAKGTLNAVDYRIITGACESGTQRFMDENHITWDEEIAIDEVIRITEGQYGHDELVELLKQQ